MGFLAVNVEMRSFPTAVTAEFGVCVLRLLNDFDAV